MTLGHRLRKCYFDWDAVDGQLRHQSIIRKSKHHVLLLLSELLAFSPISIQMFNPYKINDGMFLFRHDYHIVVIRVLHYTTNTKMDKQ